MHATREEIVRVLTGQSASEKSTCGHRRNPERLSANDVVVVVVDTEVDGRGVLKGPSRIFKVIINLAG